jgi:hypothetical protein
MPHQHICVEKRRQCRFSARACHVRRNTSSQGVPRLACGTTTDAAISMKFGVFATTARLRSTRNRSSSPSFRSSASRTGLGIVTWPFDVMRAEASKAYLLTSLWE